MANERQKRLMQKALDEQLAPEEHAELRAHLDANNSDANLFRRMQQVDTLLQDPPHERAPQRLAATIMARLAEMAEHMDPRQLSRISGLALALSLGLVAAVLIPLLIGVAWLILAAVGSAAGLTTLIQGIVGVLALIISMFESLVQSLQAFLSANPELVLLMLGLIPVSLFWLLRFGARKRAADAS